MALWMIMPGVASATCRAGGRRRSVAVWRHRMRTLLRGDGGMSTAEYAIGTLAAAGFAALLYAVVTSDAVREALTSLVQRALEGSI